MNKVYAGMIAAALAGAWAAPAWSDGNDVTMKGQILDLACYMGHGAQGAKHASCAVKCLKGGAPAGLLTGDGNVYVLVNDHKHEKAFKSLANLGGQVANVTGEKVSKGGLQAFIVEKVQKVK